MRVTIITDASFCHNTKAAGYGYWIASDRAKHGGGGQFKARVDEANTAELMAVVNAVYMAKHKGTLREGDQLIIQTDSKATIDAINNQRKNMTKGERIALQEFRRLTKGVRYHMKHVKGHTKVQDARSQSNRHCDRIAKHFMRQAREERKAA